MVRMVGPEALNLNAAPNFQGAAWRPPPSTSSLARNAGLLKKELQVVDLLLAKAQRLAGAKKAHASSLAFASQAAAAGSHTLPGRTSDRGGQGGRSASGGLTLRRALVIEVQQRCARQAFVAGDAGRGGNLPRAAPFKGGAAANARDREIIRACEAYVDTRAGVGEAVAWPVSRREVYGKFNF